MQCDTCKRESPVILRVMIAKDYNRSLARPIFNCPVCYENKEQRKGCSGIGDQGAGQMPRTLSPEPRTNSEGRAA